MKWVDESGKNVAAPSARLLIIQNNERREANLAGTGWETEVELACNKVEVEV